ncbi:MAG: hypothetical protein ACKOPT_12410, partial [Cyanobium sp.]
GASVCGARVPPGPAAAAASRKNGASDGGSLANTTSTGTGDAAPVPAPQHWPWRGQRIAWCRSGAPAERRNGITPSTVARKSANKVVHADSVDSEAPDPRWAGELAKLKSLLADQKVGV